VHVVGAGLGDQRDLGADPRPVSAPPLVVVVRNSSTESGVTRRTEVNAARSFCELTSAPSSVMFD
jgi:hypothetical protein